MENKRLLLALLVSIGLSSCLKVDGLIFLGETVSEYQFNDNTAEPEFDLDESYYVDDNLINLFTVESRAENEIESQTIYCSYIGDTSALSPGDTVIVYAHGQSGNMDSYWQRQTLLANVNGKYTYGVLSFDYRGYGMSEGTATEEGMFADSKAALKWLQDKGVPSSNVIFYGFSLGTAAATHMAANNDYRPTKLILEAPMASAQNLAEEALLINFQKEFITSLSFNNIEKIKLVDQEFCWLHGTEDDSLSIYNVEAIYANYQGSYSEDHRIQGATHGGETGVPPSMGYENYLETLGSFIRH